MQLSYNNFFLSNHTYCESDMIYENHWLNLKLTVSCLGKKNKCLLNTKTNAEVKGLEKEKLQNQSSPD